MSSMLSVVLVHRDDYERTQLRAALEALPGVQIAGERSDLRAGLALAHQARPSILVLELTAPVDDGLNAAAQFKMEHPDCAIFLMTDAFDPETLLRALRAGAQEVLRRPLDRGALSQAVERVGALNARRGGESGGRGVITVFSNKGGSGVSTIATNLAVSLRHSTRREVAIADFDYQSGDAAFMLGLSPTRSLGDVLAAARIDSASVHDALMKHEGGVYVLSQPEHLDRVDGVTPNQIGSTLEILASTFELVVVDAPHVFNEITLEVFDRSSTILLVTELSIPSVRAARRSLEILHKLNFLTAPDRVRLVVNRYSDKSAITLPQLEETLGLQVFGTVSNDYAAVSEAINMGRPLCGDGMESRAARDIAALARKLVPAPSMVEDAVVEMPTRKPARLRLFGRG
jgi:pilus assembly protein CpaE